VNKNPKYPNSAGRLLNVLDGLQPNGTLTHQLLPLIFDRQMPDDTHQQSIESIKVLTELHIMYVEFLQDLADADIPDDEKSVLEKGLASLATLMYPAASNQGARVVSESEKALLEVCATRLPKENILEDTDVGNIRESISLLRESVEELPDTSILRSILLELARLSEDSINRFNIYGAKGIKKAFKDMLAEVAEIYLQDEEDVSDIKNTPAWDTAIKHIKLFDSVAAKAMKYKPLLEKASQFLSLSGG